MIEIKNIIKKYNRVKVLDNLTFSIKQGEIFGLLGPNGAGKTTTLRIMSSLIKPDHGEVIVDKIPLSDRKGSIQGLLGVCPQEIALYPELTVQDNLLFFGMMGGLSRKSAYRRAEELIQEMDLKEKTKEKVSLLSGGMKRRLNIAVSIIHRPRVLFMDEPTVGVDPRTRAAIFTLLRSFKKNGMTIIYTTHYMEEADRLCDRVAVMDKGKIIALDTPKNLKESLEPLGEISLEEVYLRLTD
ncbi:ABC transporter ATP-binding protein [Candidatus Contubernalis alkaliaceticus]|uniref:ABC transporter ATP-binding protein n=1 Tax=Candidatus Contubernalis alkaliaceticus TaxID=338645 RepID=UPI001F4BDF8C|nr:ABC transporter ATP-binding protein [Candidatus Contubernalis alkalaceticus]UNC92617.1 ABC transporter ATP-binding protein [Candidatus Contubernalis alkalaceticus]